MRNRISPNQLYQAQKMLRDKIKTIPKENKQKFSLDLLKLIDKAHEDDYDKFQIN